MGPFIIAICVVGGMYLAVALLHMVIFIRRPELKTDLFFALMCTCVAASMLSEIGVYRAIDLSTFLPAYKMQIAFQGLQWIFLTWFVAFYTDANQTLAGYDGDGRICFGNHYPYHYASRYSVFEY